MDKLAPIKHKLRTLQVKPDWMDDSLTWLKHSVHKYERVYRRLKILKKEVYKSLSYVNSMIEECGHDAKKLYSAVNLLTNKDREVILPKEEENKIIANRFMDFLN